MIDEPRPRLPFRRILVPLALDAGEANALRYGAELASMHGATVHLLHVLGKSDSSPRLQSLARSALEQMAQTSIDSRTTREILIGVGDPADVIIDFEQVIPADLVVMRTHGRVTTARRLLGTVTERVVRGSVCPVLAIPEIA